MREVRGSILDRLALLAEKSAMGERPGRLPEVLLGHGQIPAGHRPYVAGDDLRRIDQRAWARTGRPMVRSYHREREQRLHLLLDCSASMMHPHPQRFDRAREILLALAAISLAGLEDVRISRFSSTAHPVASNLRGRSQTARLQGMLEDLQAGGATDPGAIASLLRGAPRGLSVVITDFLDERPVAEWLSALGGPMPTWVLVLVHPLDPLPEGNGEEELLDPESGRHHRVRLDDALRNELGGRLAEHRLARRRQLSNAGMRVVEMDIRRSWEELLLGPLRRSGLVLAA